MRKTKKYVLNGAERNVPGVGNYNISKGIGNGPKYTMVGKGNTGNKRKGKAGKRKIATFTASKVEF